MTTRPFKSGNSQAVRIPAEIAYEDMNTELEVTRAGDMIMIRPKRQNLQTMVDELRRMPVPGEIEVREPIEVPDREDV